MQQETKKQGFRTDDPRVGKGLLTGFAVLLVVLLGLEMKFHMHGYFGWDEWFGFNAAAGLASCFLLVLTARFVVRPLLKRDEDYYDR
jgi:hypothetical protein